MRLDSVEIKVTLAADQVAAALDEFGLDSDRPAWAIWFCEDVLRETPVAAPLLDLGVVLRVRRKGPPGAGGDATVKLRPCRRSQLIGQWMSVGGRGDDRDLKVEADWAGNRRVLATSYTVDMPDITTESGGSTSRLFSTEQQAFLADCTATPVNLDALTLLGPITATRWKTFHTGGAPSLEVRAERWRVAADVDFLELSVVATPEEAGAHQAALEQFVADHGLVAGEQETKTRMVLKALVAAAHG